MARLVGVDLPREKRMEIALTYIYGIGRTRAKESLAATGIDPNLRSADLTDEQLVKLRDWIEDKYQTEGDLRREVAADIRRKVEIGPTRAFATAADSPSVGSAPTPTLGAARARARLSPVRRRSPSSSRRSAARQLGATMHRSPQE